MLAIQALSRVAEKQYGPGVSDREIVIGQTMPYSGPLSAFGTMGRAQAAYFAMINERGGVNGRKIRLISLDDGYSPPRTVEQTRKLVESEQVLLLFSSFGTPTNASVLKYLQRQACPATVHRRDRDEVGRSGEIPLDHGVSAQPAHRQPPATSAMCWRTSRRPASASCIRTTISAATTSRRSRSCSATRPQR